MTHVIINESGKTIRLRDKTRIAAQNNADIFLSFHHDSVNRKYLNKWVYKGKKRNYSDKFQGFSLFVSSKNQRFNKSFELGIILNRKEETLLNIPSYREKLIANITKALEKFCPL